MNQLKATILFIVWRILSLHVYAETADKKRVIVLTDIENEPDEQAHLLFRPGAQEIPLK